MSVRPRWIEIHVYGKRAAPPDGDGAEKSPSLVDILASHARGEQQPQKAIQRGSEGHCETVRRGEPIRRDVRSERASEQHARVSDQQKRRPENRWPNGEMIVEMTGRRDEKRPGLAIFIEPRLAKAGVSRSVVAVKIEAVLNQWRTRKRVVANAIAANPWIHQGQRYKENDEKPALASRQRQGVRRRSQQRHAVMEREQELARPFAGRRRPRGR